MLDLLKLMSQLAICWAAEAAQGTIGGEGRRRTTKKLQGQIQLAREGGGSWGETKRFTANSFPPSLRPFLPPCNQRQALTSLHVFSTLPYVLHPFYGIHISTIWLYIWRVYIWHMINGPQLALYVQ